MATPTTYCIDACSLIKLKHFEADIFPDVWGSIGEAVTKKILHAPREVYREVTRVDDAVGQWLKKRKDIIVSPDTPQLQKVAEIQSKFPTLVDSQATIPQGDPFLIAHGIISGCTLITEEVEAGPNAKRVKIPNVCKHYKVRYITLTEFFREQGWVFRRSAS